MNNENITLFQISLFSLRGVGTRNSFPEGVIINFYLKTIYRRNQSRHRAVITSPTPKIRVIHAGRRSSARTLFDYRRFRPFSVIGACKTVSHHNITTRSVINGRNPGGKGVRVRRFYRLTRVRPPPPRVGPVRGRSTPPARRHQRSRVRTATPARDQCNTHAPNTHAPTANSCPDLTWVRAERERDV